MALGGGTLGSDWVMKVDIHPNGFSALVTETEARILSDHRDRTQREYGRLPAGQR